MNNLTHLDIKQALNHQQFRELFPELKEEIGKFLQKPGCSCNKSLFNKIHKYPERLQKYFPTKKIAKEEGKWKVINCNVDELEDKLRHLPQGQKLVSLARYENQVTVVIFFPDYYN